jgi:hypothetical protein
LAPNGTTTVYSSRVCNSFFSGSITLPVSGSYTLQFSSPYGATGTITLTGYALPPPTVAGGALTEGGSPGTAKLTVPGQQALFTFSGNAGDRISLLTQTDSSLSLQPFNVSITAPDQQTQVYASQEVSSSDFSDLLILPQTGTYSILFSSTGAALGKATVTLYAVPPDSKAGGVISKLGTAETAKITVPGQRALFTFTGKQSEAVVLSATENAGLSAECSTITVTEPDGVTTLANYSDCSTSWIGGQLTLPTAGTYSILYDPGGQTIGTASLLLRAVPPPSVAGGPIVVGGPTVTSNITVPGQEALFTFAGSAGQLISLTASANAKLAASGGYIYIYLPDGRTLLYDDYFSSQSLFSDALTLPSSGTYSILLVPYNSGTGVAKLALYNVPPNGSGGGTVTEGGPPVTVNITAPGQNAQLRFYGKAGDTVSLLTRENATLASQPFNVTIVEPDAQTSLYDSYQSPPASGDFSEALTLPLTGIYTIMDNPSGTATGTAILTLYSVPPPVMGTVTIGGPAVSVSTTVPGQGATFQFAGTAGSPATVTLSGSSGLDDQCFNIVVSQPDMTTIGGGNWCVNNGAWAPGSLGKLKQTGNYTIAVMPRSISPVPSGALVGSITAKVVQK